MLEQICLMVSEAADVYDLASTNHFGELQVD